MDVLPRPHRAWWVLAWGIAGLWAVYLMGLPVGIVACILGAIELSGMRRGTIDPSGRSIARIGLVFGIGGAILFIPMLAAGSVFVMTEGSSVSRDPADPGASLVTLYYSPGPTGLFPAPVRLQFRAVTGPDGKPLRDGHFVERTYYGWKVCEGEYRAGLRHGRWTYWNDDDSVDHERSGVYENDVKVRD